MTIACQLQPDLQLLVSNVTLPIVAGHGSKYVLINELESYGVNCTVTSCELMQMLALCCNCRLASSVPMFSATAVKQHSRSSSFECCSVSSRTNGVLEQLRADAVTQSRPHDEDQQHAMQHALHHTLHQVDKCTSQLKEFSRQQQAMQLALQIMTDNIQDGILLMQQQ